MKLHLGSSRLDGDLDSLHWHDQAAIDWLRSDRNTKALRQGRHQDSREFERVALKSTKLPTRRIPRALSATGDSHGSR